MLKTLIRNVHYNSQFRLPSTGPASDCEYNKNVVSNVQTSDCVNDMFEKKKSKESDLESDLVDNEVPEVPHYLFTV